jgi:hypothetical protein
MADEPASVRQPAVAERRAAAAPRQSPLAAAARPIPIGRTLQQRLGNQGTQTFAARLIARASTPDGAATGGGALGSLSISQPGDAPEREAESVADAVMRMAKPASKPSNGSPVMSVSPGATIERRGSEREQDGKGVRVQRSGRAAPLDRHRTVGTASMQSVVRPDRVQASLTISQPGDALEQEAEQVADTVMRMPTPPPQSPGISAASSTWPRPPVRRVCADCQDELTHTTPLGEDREGPDPTPQVTPIVEANVRALQGEGNPLPQATRDFFEPRLGADFSQVRVNTGGRAENTAKSLGAKAFTVGRSITFGAGQYAPASHEGQRLLAHELTHVVQQDPGIRRASSPAQPQDPLQNEPATEDRQQSSLRSESPANQISRPTTLPASLISSDSEEGVSLNIGKTIAAPTVQRDAWYNFDIPFTDYEFDPSLEGLKTAAGLAAETAKEGAVWVKDRVVAGVEWVFEKIKDLITAGIDWLTKQFDAIKEFAVSSFADIRTALGSAMGGITSPITLITSSIANMDAGILAAAWGALSAGANVAWQAVKSVIDGVLAFGGGIWNTVSRYVTSLFSAVGGLLDSAPFKLLPDFLQDAARSLYASVRSLWTSIQAFWTDFWKRLTSYVRDLLESVEGFVQKIMSYAIDSVIATVKTLKEVYDFVKLFVTDPEAVIEPVIASLADKIRSEAPGKAREVAQEKMTEAMASARPPRSSSTVIQRSPDGASKSADRVAIRSTATRAEVNKGLEDTLADQWAALVRDIPEMLWKTFKNTFWPPDTIRAIGHEFYELWDADWKSAADSLFLPRNIFDDFAGFWHDVWSNLLVLLDFPLALWRRLNSILMLLMGYVSILLIVVGAVGGFAVGNMPGALAGATAGFKLALAVGEALFWSFVLAESSSALKAFLDLFTARQTQQAKDRDYLQIAGSVIGAGIAVVIRLLFSLLGRFAREVVRRIKPRGGSPPKQLGPGEEGPKTEPRGEEPKTERPEVEPPKTEAEPVPEAVTLSATEIAEQLIAKYKGSIRAALAELNRMNLSQSKAADVVEAMYRASGRNVANRVMLPDGRLVLTSVRPGDFQPINLISTEGKVSFGKATLSLTGDLKAPIAVSNVIPD